MLLNDFLHTVYVPSRLELSREAIHQMTVTIRVTERWANRALSIHELDETLVRAFLVDYRREHAAATTNSKRCHLLALWQCAFDEDVVSLPPRRRKIRRAKPRPQIPEAWQVSEVARVIAEAKRDTRPIADLPAGLWWESLLLVLFDTGERRGAALAASIEDLKLPHGGIVFRHTKTRRPRWCLLHADTLDRCRRLVRLQSSRQIIWPWPYSREMLEHRFRKILARAGVSYGRGKGGLFHKLRRTSGSLVEAAGGDGSRHLGNTRAVFEQSYRDPRICRGSQLDRLPRPKLGGGNGNGNVSDMMCG
jgi:integrase